MTVSQSESVTPYAARKFGRRARPRLVGVYAGAGGWAGPPEPGRLTRESAVELIAMGYTMVRVRWHWRTHEIILRRYLGR